MICKYICLSNIRFPFGIRTGRSSLLGGHGFFQCHFPHRSDAIHLLYSSTVICLFAFICCPHSLCFLCLHTSVEGKSQPLSRTYFAIFYLLKKLIHYHYFLYCVIPSSFVASSAVKTQSSAALFSLFVDPINHCVSKLPYLLFPSDSL